MARRLLKDAMATRENILSNALSLFASHGYDQTTFNDIARKLKMTKGAVYWHFESKEALLMALLDRETKRFAAMISELMPDPDSFTFPLVCETMLRAAAYTINEPELRDFFICLRTQVRWGNASMAVVREKLLSDETIGPKQAFRKALKNDKAAGLIREDVNINETVEIMMALWDGLVQSKIAEFLESDLEATLRRAYEATWRSLKS